MPSPSRDTINAMDQPAFVQAFGAIFENAPWVAEKAWHRRPFASLDALHAAMVDVVKHAPLPTQLALLLNHPDLAGKEAAAGDMTESSVSEQASAGFDALSKAEMTAMSDHNAAYRQKFGFPFIIAVRMHTKDGIFFDIARRLRNDTQTEYAYALQSVYAITLMRLQSLIEGSDAWNPTKS